MKTHIYRPGEEISLCGRKVVAKGTNNAKAPLGTNNPLEISCITCETAFKNNIMWYWSLRNTLEFEGKIDAFGKILDGKPLWEGEIPVVTGFRYDEITANKAKAFSVGDRVRIEIDLDAETAAHVRAFLEHQDPICLSWTTRPYPGQAGDLARENYKEARSLVMIDRCMGEIECKERPTYVHDGGAFCEKHRCKGCSEMRY